MPISLSLSLSRKKKEGIFDAMILGGFVSKSVQKAAGGHPHEWVSQHTAIGPCKLQTDNNNMSLFFSFFFSLLILFINGLTWSVETLVRGNHTYPDLSVQNRRIGLARGGVCSLYMYVTRCT